LERRLLDVAGVRNERVGHVADEVIDLFAETLDEFIETRHAALQREGYTSEAIYRVIQNDLEDWRFKAPSLSLRQIRRRIYG
jgi:hypothetical protein